MILVRAADHTPRSAVSGLAAEMTRYHDELRRAGVLLDASGLQPSATGWRIRYAGGRREVIEGPFAEATAPVAGYTLIEVASRDEAMEWSRRYPNPSGDGVCEIEVRQLVDVEAIGEAPDGRREARRSGNR